MKSSIILILLLASLICQLSCDDSTDSKVENVVVKVVIYRDTDTSLIDTLYLTNIPHVSMETFSHGTLSYSSSLNVMATSEQPNDSSYAVFLIKNEVPPYLDGFALRVGSGVYRSIAGNNNFNASGYGFEIDGLGKPTSSNIQINATGDTELMLDIAPNSSLKSRASIFELYELPDSSNIDLSILEKSNTDMVVVTQINSNVFMGSIFGFGYLKPTTTIRLFCFIPNF